MNVLIIGSGYSGLNAWHTLKSVKKIIVDQDATFKFYSNLSYVLDRGGKRVKFRR